MATYLFNINKTTNSLEQLFLCLTAIYTQAVRQVTNRVACDFPASWQARQNQ